MKAQIVNDLIIKGLLEMGATPAPAKDFGYPGHYDILTRYGLLTVCLHQATPTRGKRATYGCFGCFANPKDNPYCSPYTGKYNWCVFAKDFTPERFAECVLRDMRMMLDKLPTV